MMLDPARALRVIQDIDKLGVLISIDDFGTGYSSLGYLRDLPVHALKIDRSFVAGMRNNTDDRIIVESTAQMAHAMRLELVAEGVETEWDAQFLSAAGFDYAQGFHYCAARPPTNAWPGSRSSTPPRWRAPATTPSPPRRAPAAGICPLLRCRRDGHTATQSRAELTQKRLLRHQLGRRRKPSPKPDVGRVVQVLKIFRDAERHQVAVEAVADADRLGLSRPTARRDRSARVYTPRLA